MLIKMFDSGGQQQTTIDLMNPTETTEELGHEATIALLYGMQMGGVCCIDDKIFMPLKETNDQQNQPKPLPVSGQCASNRHHEVEEHMRAIAESADATPKKKSVLELAKENGFDLSRVRDQRGIVDAMTGKRMQED